MPGFLPPEFVRLELRDDKPVIVLHVDIPAGLESDGWSLMSRATVWVIDGPNGAGYLIPRFGIQPPAGWDEAVARMAGSLVVFGFEPMTASRFIAAT
jgi:hypothetical protein